MLEVLAVISSDALCPLIAADMLQGGLARVVQTFSTGAECLKALTYQEPSSSCLVIVDTVVSDIAPLNLCDALRSAYPQVVVVAACAQEDSTLLAHVMMAGAQATVARRASKKELAALIHQLTPLAEQMREKQQKSVITRPSLSQKPSYWDERERRAVVVPVIGARGGAGRSTLSLLLALVAARADVDVALVDLDLQFGNLALMLHTRPQSTLTNLVQALEAGEHRVRVFSEKPVSGLSFYASSPEVSLTNGLVGRIRLIITALATEHELIVINTGTFWTLAHIELLELADVALCVLDQSLAGVYMTQRLQSLCQRSGIPLARLCPLINRMRAGYLSAEDIGEALDAPQIRSISDGGATFAQALDAGDIAQALSSATAPCAAEIALVLDDIASCTNLALNALPHMRATIRRGARRKESLSWLFS